MAKRVIKIPINLLTIAYTFWVASMVMAFMPKHFKLIHNIQPLFLLAFIILLLIHAWRDHRKFKERMDQTYRELLEHHDNLMRQALQQMPPPQSQLQAQPPGNASPSSLQNFLQNMNTSQSGLGRAAQPNENEVAKQLNQESKKRMKR